MRAHQIIRQVQLEQKKMFSPTKNPKPLVIVTPTYARAAQALHLTALAQTLRLVPYRVTWFVVEAGGITNGTASILTKSRVPFVHASFHESMPDIWESRRVVEAKMRVHALR
jgi:putative beta-1,4-xylosyltransferase IRX14